MQIVVKKNKTRKKNPRLENLSRRTAEGNVIMTKRLDSMHKTAISSDKA